LTAKLHHELLAKSLFYIIYTTIGNKWQNTYNNILKKGFRQENSGKKQSAGTVGNRPQYLHEPSKSPIKRTKAESLTVQQMQGDTSYQVHSELGFRASLHDTPLCISSEVSEYFKVIKIIKFTGGVII
jgi:hypothetical protein